MHKELISNRKRLFTTEEYFKMAKAGILDHREQSMERFLQNIVHLVIILLL